MCHILVVHVIAKFSQGSVFPRVCYIQLIVDKAFDCTLYQFGLNTFSLRSSAYNSPDLLSPAQLLYSAEISAIMLAPMQFIFAFYATFYNSHVEAAASATLQKHTMRRKDEAAETISMSLGIDPAGSADQKNENNLAQSGENNLGYDDLQEARDADLEEEKYHEITPENVELGKLFIEGKYGKLYVRFMKTMVDFIGYYATVIDGAGTGDGPNGTNLTREYPDKETMSTHFADWRAEVLKFEDCPEGPLDMEVCMTVTRCLIESEVGKTINASYFAVFVEMQDTVSTTVIKDFELYFEEARKTALPTCAGEPRSDGETKEVASFIDQFEASSDRQWRAVSAVATVQQAAELTERASAKVGDGASTSFQAIWHPPCASLGCDKSSLQDIGQVLHGHMVELVEVNAPGPVIRMYVRAMRKAIHSSKVWMGQAVAKDIQVVLETPGHHAAANRLYNQQLKRDTGVLDAAYALLIGQKEGTQWGGRRRRRWGIGKVFKAIVKVVVAVVVAIFNCVGVGASVVIAYAKKFPCNCAVASIIVAYGVAANFMELILRGNAVCVGRAAKIAFAIVVGYVAGDPAAAMLRAGVSIEASFSWNGCTGALNLSLSAGIVGVIVWASSACPFGHWKMNPPWPYPLWMLSIFTCATGLAVGLTVFCCNFNLLTGSSNCR